MGNTIALWLRHDQKPQSPPQHTILCCVHVMTKTADQPASQASADGKDLIFPDPNLAAANAPVVGNTGYEEVEYTITNLQHQVVSLADDDFDEEEVIAAEPLEFNPQRTPTKQKPVKNPWLDPMGFLLGFGKSEQK